MKKKLIIVIGTLGAGGAEKSLVSLLSVMDYQRYEVDLLILKDGGFFRELVPLQVNIIPIPRSIVFLQKTIYQALNEAIRYRKGKELFARLSGSFAQRIGRYVNKNLHYSQLYWKCFAPIFPIFEKEYDAAIGFGQGVPTYLIVEKIRAAKKITWVNTNYTIAGYDSTFDHPYFEKLNRLFTVSDVCRNVLVSTFPDFKSKITVMYDIIDPSLVRSMAAQGEGYTDEFDGLRFLTIGRMTPEKGYDIALEACRSLKSEGLNFRWYVIGDGLLRDEIKNRIIKFGLEDYFILLGQKQNPYPYIQQCDIYIQPSRNEGLSIAITEARILFRPIITTNYPTAYDQIIHGINGIIVEMRAEELSKSIISLAMDKQLRGKMSDYLADENVDTQDEIHKLYLELNLQIEKSGNCKK